jgi:quercetin dioxygenase-like cupin family protein
MSASTGKVLDLRPLFGITATIVTPAEDTGGCRVEMDITADPGSRTTIHRHPEQTETYEVLEGVLDVLHNGTWHQVPAGESFLVPHGSLHAFRNRSDAPVRFINVHRPALQFQAHLELLDQLVRSGKVRSTKDPKSLLYMCVSAVTYQPDVSVKPPQQLISTIGWLGRRIGLRVPEPA